MDVKCPYCPETRPNRTRLQLHVDGVHRDAGDWPTRKAAVDAARTVEDVAVVDVVEPEQCPSKIPAGNNRLYRCPQVKGHEGDHGLVGFSPRWADSRHGSKRCPSVLPAGLGRNPYVCPRDEGHEGDHGRDGSSPRWANTVDNAVRAQCDQDTEELNWDRSGLEQRLSEQNDRLATAGSHMAKLRASLDKVDERMRKLDVQLTSPATVRHATLNQVWDRLREAGNIEGAVLVMKMIKNVVDDQ